MLAPAFLLLLLAVSPPATVDELKTAIHTVLKRDQVPGAGFALVAADRVVWTGGVGKSDLASGTDVSARTVFRMGSISKSFVALALLKLREESRISLETPLREALPGIAFPNPWEATNPVRIAHVMEHTGGFNEAQFGEGGAAPPGLPMREILLRFPGAHRVRWPPGTRMAYSNHGYVVAACLIEKATGMSYDEYIREAVLKPLGMEQSGFRLSDAPLAQGYDRRPPRPVRFQSTYLAPAGDLMSSPADMARFLRMLLNRGKVGDRQVVAPESLERMEQPRTSLAARMGLKGGYGVANYAMGNTGRRGHGGMIRGFKAIYAYMPDAGRGYAVMLNSFAPSRALRDIDRLLFDYVAAGVPKPQPLPTPAGEARLRQFAGVYVPADFRSQMAAFSEVLPRSKRVVFEDGALYQVGLLGEGRQQLIPVSATAFRTKDEQQPSRVFVAGADGEMVLTSGWEYHERVAAWKVYGYAAAVALALLLMLSSVAYGLVWIPARLRRRPVKHAAVRAYPLAATLSLAGAALLVTAFVDDMSVLGRVNVRTVGYCVLTWTFAALSLRALLLARRSKSYELRPAVRLHSLAVSIACWIVTMAMAHWGLLGTRLWLH